jgi:hypothetical protein
MGRGPRNSVSHRRSRHAALRTRGCAETRSERAGGRRNEIDSAGVIRVAILSGISASDWLMESLKRWSGVPARSIGRVPDWDSCWRFRFRAGGVSLFQSKDEPGEESGRWWRKLLSGLDSEPI